MTTMGMDNAESLAAALDAAGGCWAELSRTSGVPVSTLKSRGQRIGVKPGMSARKKVSFETVTASFEPILNYLDQMEEFLNNTGFWGYPALHGMFELCDELGLDMTTRHRLAERAVELARQEHNRIMDGLWALWNEFEYGIAPSSTEPDDEEEG